MLTFRYAQERGRSQSAWLESYHTFSFADYDDPAHRGFSVLRVLNDDTVAPGMGFATHGHRDMEIISYVLEGALEHKDSLGTGSVIPPGEVQRMSAGTGVTHSEQNASLTEPVRFLQIWILPNVTGIAPSYEQRTFAPQEIQGQLRLVASPNGRAGSVIVHQDVLMFVARLSRGGSVKYAPTPGRSIYVHVARGSVMLNGHMLVGGDGAALRDEGELQLSGADEGEVLVFDLP